jgi:hypothetical protein
MLSALAIVWDPNPASDGARPATTRRAERRG